VDQDQAASDTRRVDETSSDPSRQTLSGENIYREYYGAVVDRILKPLFFASIGFSIPISQLFTGAIVWRGIVYTILMLLGKMVCGLWLVRFSGLSSLPTPAFLKRSKKGTDPTTVASTASNKKKKRQTLQPSERSAQSQPRSASMNSTSQTQTQANTSKKLSSSSSKIPKPKSLYPPMMLGSAMVARGEIGFLISSLAESTGIFNSGSEQGSSELFLVVTWAVLLCTIIGPLSIGIMVKRVRRLQQREREDGTRAGREDPLGIWGVGSTAS